MMEINKNRKKKHVNLHYNCIYSFTFWCITKAQPNLKTSYTVSVNKKYSNVDKMIQVYNVSPQYRNDVVS